MKDRHFFIYKSNYKNVLALKILLTTLFCHNKMDN